MNTVREYRMPLLIGAGALVLALILYAVLVAPQSSKLSSLHAKEAQLQTQETALQAKLTALKTEKQNLTKSCADLEKIATQIPSVETPTDVDAEESSFESQFNGLAKTSGVTLTQFSGFTPATTATAAAPPPGTPSSHADVVAVPTTLTVTGNYAKMTAFINGLDNFPRLFVIQQFNLTYGHRDSSPHRGRRAPAVVCFHTRCGPSQRATPVGRRNPDLTYGGALHACRSTGRSTTPRPRTPWPPAPRPRRRSTDQD